MHHAHIYTCAYVYVCVWRMCVCVHDPGPEPEHKHEPWGACVYVRMARILQNLSDASHGLANCLKTMVKIAAGRGAHGLYKEVKRGTDKLHRLESELHNVFPKIWIGRMH